MKAYAAALLAVMGAAAAGPAFVDEALRAGLKDRFYCGDDAKKTYIIETLGTGAAFIDFDNDGLLDVFAVTASKLDGFPAGEEPVNRLYRNKGDGTFADVTKKAGLGKSGWGQGVCAGDIDNDGFEDLYVTYYGHDVLYRNRGDGTFEDITRTAGVATGGVRWGTGCAFVDYDRDGKLDLFVANYVQFDRDKTPHPDSPNACQWKSEKVMCGPQGLQGGVNRLWHNESTAGTIKFAEVSRAAGIEAPGERYSLSVTAFDYDRDGWPDIYVAVDSQASLLFKNKRDGTFDEVALESGVALSEDGREQAGMGSAVGDFDGDGWPDLAKTNFSDDVPNLYRNHGDGTFVDTVATAGMGRNREFLGWGVAFLDFDNDLWPDVFMVNGHVYPGLKNTTYEQRRILYRNLANGKAADISEQAGPAVMAKTSARGLSTGDYNNDGHIDVLITNMNQPLSLLRNTGSANRALTLKLIGTKSNRSAIGAVATVTVGARKLTGEVLSGSTYLSQSDLRLHFGTGQAARADAIEIRWPAGQTERIEGIETGRIVTITEGKGVTATSAYRGQR